MREIRIVLEGGPTPPEADGWALAPATSLQLHGAPPTSRVYTREVPDDQEPEITPRRSATRPATHLRTAEIVFEILRAFATTEAALPLPARPERIALDDDRIWRLVQTLRLILGTPDHRPDGRENRLYLTIAESREPIEATLDALAILSEIARPSLEREREAWRIERDRLDASYRDARKFADTTAAPSPGPGRTRERAIERASYTAAAFFAVRVHTFEERLVPEPSEWALRLAVALGAIPGRSETAAPDPEAAIAELARRCKVSESELLTGLADDLRRKFPAIEPRAILIPEGRITAADCRRRAAELRARPDLIERIATLREALEVAPLPARPLPQEQKPTHTKSAKTQAKRHPWKGLRAKGELHERLDGVAQNATAERERIETLPDAILGADADALAAALDFERGPR